MATKIVEKGGIRFRSYEQDFKIELPVLAVDLVKDNVLAQVIDEIVERIPMSDLEIYYSKYGSPGYHPKMLIKVWTYAYCEKIYTSRPLAKKLREDVVFMWLSGNQRPDFKTLSNFRSMRMQGMIDIVFTTVLGYLVEHGYIDLDDLYVDGSKWEANGNKYKKVWRKNTERYKSGVLERIEEILKEYEALQVAEDTKYGSKDLKLHQTSEQISVVLNSTDLQTAINRMESEIAAQSDKVKQKAVSKLKRGLEKEVPKLEKYEEQEHLLAGRNSYSKTDTDATMLRMKDEQLLPGYNVEITTSNQYAIAGSIHQNASDSVTLPPHWEQVQTNVAGFVEEDWNPALTADAGYGSEENYDLLESKSVRAFVKYPTWYKEKTGELAKRTYYFHNWKYDETQDIYYCPNDRKLIFREIESRMSQNGYERKLRVYECESCKDCPLFKDCRGERAKPDTNRTVRTSPNLEQHKAKVRVLLDTEQGREKRAKRSVDVETPFGDIKYNQRHRRFILRGLEKVNVEFSFLLIAHNIRKIECEKTGKWREYYAQRAAKSAAKSKKRA